MIAIVGKLASGKTTFIKQAAKLGFSTFICDEFIADLYANNYEIISEIKQEIGEFLIENNQVSKPKIKEWILKDAKNLEKLEKIAFSYLDKHFQTHEYDLVEIPILHNKFFDFSKYFSVIFYMQIDDKQRGKFLKNRGVNKLLIKIFDDKNSYNWGEKEFYNQKKVVNISLNKRDNLQKIKYLIERHL
ncbi:dephospho-CoA kinase [Mycoplasma sp. Pen4]|uniref:dephospho-CoA kinase n=1 Tax=Mycoplasma sp. Pen4 TaxID=640330 RepID=UPI001654900A|nr:dephospho-CoA kinase [Mycoplasma sp. Pen4]QNM93840.1 dephospho-CoA kinase [Mycoplasma sp. Pen4]